VARGTNYLWTFFLGFAGGLVALLTPCVFPMIPLTVSFFTKDTKRKGWMNALLYGASIIVIYVSIGLLITGVFGATALNELSTNAIANTLFFLIFVIFAFSFFGYYEIQLPSSWANKSDSMADKGGLIGIFFMAFTLAIVSFSCTGPIIGSAIVQSATSTLGPFVVMLGFSVALAIPFGLFAAFPAFLNSLPKSGSWMNSVKVVLGFLELALALKFLSVADMTMHWGILKYELFMGLWVIIFLATTLYLFGFIKFPHDSPLKKLSPQRWLFSLSFLALTIYLATGFFYNEKTQSYDSLKLMSGLAPPAQYNYLLPEPALNPDIKSRYISYTKCANNLDCFKDYYEGLAYAKEVNKPILLDFTGYGCVNCRKTEEHIWVRDEVWNQIAEDYVLISLYVDDRKALDDILLSKSRETKLRNVGNKWADFQIVNFEQNSQPLYVMMTPDEKVMAKPRGYKEGVEDYADFLSCGLEVYNALDN
jgi:thiol:disulfide interchange protein DsbD